MATARRWWRARAIASAIVATAAGAGAACAPDTGTPNVRRLADEGTAYAVQRLALDSLFSGRALSRTTWTRSFYKIQATPIGF